MTVHTQPGTKRQNLWGLSGGLEAQRADLWELDVSAVCRYLRQADSRLVPGVDLKQLPVSDDLAAHARLVTFPATQTKLRPVTTGTVPRNMPGYLTEYEQVRVEFVHDTPGESIPSAVVTVLYAWASLARLGRDGGMAAGRLLSASYKPTYRFNLPVTLLQGSDDGIALEPNVSYVLHDAWLAVLQLGELNQESSQVHQVTAGFYCGWISRQVASLTN